MSIDVESNLASFFQMTIVNCIYSQAKKLHSIEYLIDIYKGCTLVSPVVKYANQLCKEAFFFSLFVHILRARPLSENETWAI